MKSINKKLAEKAKAAMIEVLTGNVLNTTSAKREVKAFVVFLN